MIRRTLYIGILIFFCNLLLSILSSCGCKERPEYCVKITGLILDVYDNSGLEPKPVENSTVYGKALKMEFSIIGTAELCRSEA